MSATYSIFPAIGVARVGNSEEYYLAPESPGGLPILPDGKEFEPADFRDSEHKLRRQAARFRVYRCDDDGTVEEVLLGQSDVRQITWEVYVANKKPVWYQFITNNGEQGYPPDHPWRNANRDHDERVRMIIDPGPRTLAGACQSASFCRSTSPDGTFPPENLEPYTIDSLGNAWTDEEGRLIFAGGFGHSGSDIHPARIKQYANNDGWWDDTSDGYVRAVVELNDGTRVEASPAAVLTAPPKYAPQLVNLVTLFDTIYDTAVRHQNFRPTIFANQIWNTEYQPDFETEIWPILRRGEGYPWVAAIPPKPHAFDKEKLGDPDPQYNSLRQFYFNIIRPSDQPNTLKSATNGQTLMPYLAGDNCLNEGQLTSTYLTVTDTQYFLLQQWAAGKFRTNSPNTEWNEAEHLTWAALENCVGGAFSPGIEMTWVSRLPAIYAAPFRPKFREKVARPLSLDLNLTVGLEPGDLSKFMAVPWQADFNECSSQPIGSNVLWWWPVQRPEFVYVTDSDGNRQQVPWVGTAVDQTADGFISFSDDIDMVKFWDKLGFVFNFGSDESPDFQETERVLPREPSPGTSL